MKNMYTEMIIARYFEKNSHYIAALLAVVVTLYIMVVYYGFLQPV